MSAPDPATLNGYYALYMRTGLFTGFLTLAGFLFATVQFVTANMKQHLYDTKAYRQRIAAVRTEQKGATIYGPLGRLLKFLIAALLFSLLTSVLQFTLGLVQSDAAAAVCLAFAAVSVALLVVSVWLIRGNLRDMLTDWEADGNEKLAIEQHPPTSPPVNPPPPVRVPKK